MRESTPYVTGRVVVDLGHVARRSGRDLGDSDARRRAVQDACTAPAGAAVELYVGADAVDPVVVRTFGAHGRHLGQIDVRGYRPDAVTAWVRALRATFGQYAEAVVA